MKLQEENAGCHASRFISPGTCAPWNTWLLPELPHSPLRGSFEADLQPQSSQSSLIQKFPVSLLGQVPRRRLIPEESLGPASPPPPVVGNVLEGNSRQSPRAPGLLGNDCFNRCFYLLPRNPGAVEPEVIPQGGALPSASPLDPRP